MRYLLITFMRKAGGQIDEMVKPAKQVRPADWSTCNIIMDYGLKKVEKSVVEGNKLDTSFEVLNDYYKQIYPALITQLEKEAEITMQSKKQKTGN